MSYPNAIEVCRAELFTKEVELRERYPGQMVETFNDWCFADGRQPGDYGIVKTDYGYHLMYFVGRTPIWEYYTRQDYILDKSNAMVQELIGRQSVDVDYGAITLGLVNLAG